jgi:hypothetical protein
LHPRKTPASGSDIRLSLCENGGIEIFRNLEFKCFVPGLDDNVVFKDLDFIDRLAALPPTDRDFTCGEMDEGSSIDDAVIGSVYRDANVLNLMLSASMRTKIGFVGVGSDRDGERDRALHRILCIEDTLRLPGAMRGHPEGEVL